MRADLFILSLLASVTLGLIWAAAGGSAGVLLGLYLLATTVLFGSVLWSKFAHMLRDAPMDMGLGIKREAPRHY